MIEHVSLVTAGSALVIGVAASLLGGAVGGVLIGGKTLVVADSGNSRVLLWDAAS